MLIQNCIWDLTKITDRDHARLEFPDLTRFKGYWYCAFREGDIHYNHPSGRVRIIRSADGEQWATVRLLEWAGGDVREPKFSIDAEGHLMVNTSVCFVSKEPRTYNGQSGLHFLLDQPADLADDQEMNVSRQSLTWLSTDGVNWGSAYACPSGVNTWRWAVTWHNGMGYSLGYGGKDGQGSLYRTRDGRSWRALLQNVFPSIHGNEASIVFDRDNIAYCLLRGRLTRGMIGIGTPPHYQQWTWKPMSVDWQGGGTAVPVDQAFGGPLRGPKLIRLHDGRFLAAVTTCRPQEDHHVVLFWMNPETAVLTRFTEFEASRSYAGLVEHEGVLWVTFGNDPRSKVELTQIQLPRVE